MNASRDEALLNFMQLTDTDPEFARSWLQDHGWDVDRAVNGFLELGGGSARASAAAAAAPPVTAPPPAADSDYFKSEALLGASADTPMYESVAVHGAMGGGLGRGRAPPKAAPVDPFRNFGSEAPGARGSEEDSLGALFKPPVEILFKGDFEAAVKFAEKEQKWLIANIQAREVFTCHMLNRDTWSDSKVKDVISTSFVLWQQESDSPAGRWYISTYKSSDFPQIDLIDPETRACLKHIEGFIDAEKMKETLTAFAHDHEWGNAVPAHLRRAKHQAAHAASGGASGAFVVDDDDVDIVGDDGPANSDDELQAAIAASLGADVLPKKKAGPATRKRRASKEASASADTSAAAGASDEATLRDVQHKEYLASLHADQKRERERKEQEEIEQAVAMSVQAAEEDAKRQRQAEEDARKALASTLPDEPAQGTPDTTTLMLRLPDGNRHMRRFADDTNIATVMLFLDSVGIASSNHVLATARPRVLLSDPNQTLKEANLCPQSVLFIEDLHASPMSP